MTLLKSVAKLPVMSVEQLPVSVAISTGSSHETVRGVGHGTAVCIKSKG